MKNICTIQYPLNIYTYKQYTLIWFNCFAKSVFIVRYVKKIVNSRNKKKQEMFHISFYLNIAIWPGPWYY